MYAQGLQTLYAGQHLGQPNTTLLDCILYLLQYLYDPAILPGSA